MAVGALGTRGGLSRASPSGQRSRRQKIESAHTERASEATAVPTPSRSSREKETRRCARKRSESGPSSRTSSERKTTAAAVSRPTAGSTAPSIQRAMARLTSSDANVFGSVRDA